MNRYVRVDRGAGSRAGQLLRHVDDPNRWQVRVFLHRDARGKQVRISEVVIGRKRDAERRLTELLQSRNQGKLAPRSTLTLTQLVKEWLKHKGSVGEATARTVQGYRQVLHRYALPVLGHRRVQDLTLREVEHLYANMRAGTLPRECKAAGWQGKPLGGRAVQLVHTALNQAMKQATRQGMLTHNPLADAAVGTARPKEKRVLAVSEREAFLTAATEQHAFYRLFYKLLLDTGLRPGEACALQWGDLDLTRDRLTVARAVTRGTKGERILAPPKTKKSRRTIPLFGLAPELAEHYRWQAEVGLDESGFVFTNETGGMLAPWALNTREFDRVCQAANITGFTLYGCRHTFATLHLQSGTPLKVVSDWLGHATIQKTANTYMHLSNDASMDWAERHTEWLRREVEATRARAVN